MQTIIAHPNFEYLADEISIEDLIHTISGIEVLSNIELLFEFYEVYKNNTSKEVQQDFEQFGNWAKMLLQDFNEIDRYLLKPEHVFDYLKNIDDITYRIDKLLLHKYLGIPMFFIILLIIFTDFPKVAFFSCIRLLRILIFVKISSSIIKNTIKCPFFIIASIPF